MFIDFFKSRFWEFFAHVKVCYYDNFGQVVLKTAETNLLLSEHLFVARSKERKAKCEEWLPKYFQQDLKSGQWVYKHSDLRPWDPRNDLYQFEHNYVIQTRTKHATPMIRTASIVSVEPQSVINVILITIFCL